jgi:hypothetical protein
MPAKKKTPTKAKVIVRNPGRMAEETSVERRKRLAGEKKVKSRR